MRLTCWMDKATDTRSDYLTFITFQWQEWLRERASTLPLYIHIDPSPPPHPNTLYFIYRLVMSKTYFRLFHPCERPKYCKATNY